MRVAPIWMISSGRGLQAGGLGVEYREGELCQQPLVEGAALLGLPEQVEIVVLGPAFTAW